jgi:antitoxin HicB
MGVNTSWKMINPYIGSDFETFLEEEGLLPETEAVAVQRVLAFQIERMLEAQKLSRTQMSRRMKTSRAALDRLLDPHRPGSSIQDVGAGRACAWKAITDPYCLMKMGQSACARTRVVLRLLRGASCELAVKFPGKKASFLPGFKLYFQTAASG